MSKPYECDECGATFLKEAQRNGHTATHSRGVQQWLNDE